MPNLNSPAPLQVSELTAHQAIFLYFAISPHHEVEAEFRERWSTALKQKYCKNKSYKGNSITRQ